mmetsp:Transcript_16909/g.28138  ORF Transcript_16909/g.28138 Transcript_16909/m.28138 type:complete len:373 (+) Transcript_16909:216-1334(+)
MKRTCWFFLLAHPTKACTCDGPFPSCKDGVCNYQSKRAVSADLYHATHVSYRPHPQKPWMKHQYVAACVVGAVRGFVRPAVYSNFQRHVQPFVDLFFHLFIGEEVSSRGQSGNISRESLQLLRELTAGAKVVQIQTEENPFNCGMQSWGRHFKIATCAKSAIDYDRRHKSGYTHFLLLRPDIVYAGPVQAPDPHCIDALWGRKNDGSWFSERGEVVFVPFTHVALVSSINNDTRCCNASYHGLCSRPIYQHLLFHGLRSVCTCSSWQHAIARYGTKHTDFQKLWHLGYRKYVPQIASPKVLTWADLALGDNLNVAIGTNSINPKPGPELQRALQYDKITHQNSSVFYLQNSDWCNDQHSWRNATLKRVPSTT